MSNLKKLLVFNTGEVLKTKNGELTDWTFVSESHINPSTYRRFINVKCKCGREKIVNLNNIRTGSSICCGKLPCGKKIIKIKDPEVGFRAIFYVYKKHARERNLEFHIDYEYFKKLIQNNCYYCDTPPKQIYQLKNPKTGTIRSGIPIKYNGIDRIDSLKGYTKSNIVTCCKICNRSKSNMQLIEFINWIKKIYLITIKNKKNGTSDRAC
jgi:hypothetical protein